MTLQETDGLWHKEEMTLTFKFERAWADDKTLKFTDIYADEDSQTFAVEIIVGGVRHPQIAMQRNEKPQPELGAGQG